MTTELDRIMAKLAADGVTVTTRLAPGVPETDRPATRIRDAARRAGSDGDRPRQFITYTADDHWCEVHDAGLEGCQCPPGATA